jgi:Protein of unknown function (DUF3306)
MTGYENFVSRWARVKRNAGLGRATEGVTEVPDLSTPEAGSPGAAVSESRSDAAADEVFDPAGLPPIEAITFNTDIRGFLQSGVPAELARAALRQAWASDPAIRDFIGIAENQWDFNDPNAIPGFGPLQEQDSAPALLARALGRHDNLAKMIPKVPLAVEQSLPAVTDSEPVHLDQSAPPKFENSPSINIHGLREDRSGVGTAVGNDAGAEEDKSRRNRRAHGSAMPR